MCRNIAYKHTEDMRCFIFDLTEAPSNSSRKNHSLKKHLTILSAGSLWMLEISLRLANNHAQQGTEDSVIQTSLHLSSDIYHNLISLKKML